MEASTGIEPVWTDLQSYAFPNEINAQGPKKYQDKAGTAGELDTGAKFDPTKENAATSAKVNGVKTCVEVSQLPPEYSALWAGAPEIILRHFCGVV